MAIPILPSELIENILSRLSPKPLIRFKCVSKQWFSLINSPSFIKLHLKQTLISDKKPNLVVTRFSLSSSPIPDEKDAVLRFTELDHPLKELCKNQLKHDFDFDLSPEILGTCDGIICVALFGKTRVFLYNPSLNSHREISCFKPSPESNPYPVISGDNMITNLVIFGFGYDAVTDEYKLVRLIETYKYRTLVSREASVYKMRDNSWKCVDDKSKSMGFEIHHHMGVLFNDRLHFLLVRGKECKVKCFNLQTETFSLMDVPKFDENFHYESYGMRELGGCFCVSVNHVNPDFDLEKADLWVMKEYGNENSWFRLFTVQGKDELVVPRVRPVIYSKDKKRVLLQLDVECWGWYDWGEERVERVKVDGLPSCHPACDAWIVVESLVSLGKDKDDNSKANNVPKKPKNKSRSAMDGFLSSGFKLRL